MLVDSRTLLETVNIEASSAKGVELLGRLDVRCVLFILKKGKEAGDKVFGSIDEIAKAFIVCVVDAVASVL